MHSAPAEDGAGHEAATGATVYRPFGASRRFSTLASALLTAVGASGAPTADRAPSAAALVTRSGAGDRINVYGVIKAGSDPKMPQGGAHLIMQNTEVLNVNGTTLAATQGQPGGTGLLYLLAVSPAEAERLVYLSTFESLYFSLMSKDAAPVAATPGASIADALKQF
jgi:hypothetical protein